MPTQSKVGLTNSILFTLVISVLATFAAGPAAADPWKDESGNRERGYEYREERGRERGEYKYEWQDGNCKYEYKEDRNGYKEERKCRSGGRHAGGPPPWAPAHGYRRDRGEDHYAGSQATYVPPFDIGLGRCNREQLGSLLGAGAGGLAGAQFGKGDGKLAAVAGGTLLGFLIGGSIGRSMDAVDQNCIGQALEHAGDGQRIAWNNPATGAQYQVTPTETVQASNGNYCREYITTAVVNGRAQQVHGQACRQPDGTWKLAN